MSDSWHIYPSVFALGHGAIADLLLDPVIVEEKIDGSQFSFGIFDGVLRARSHRKELVLDAPEKMFQSAVDVIRTLPLHDGWTYRAECLSKPKHGVLAYDRTPEKGLIIFDINIGHEKYLIYNAKQAEAARMGLETVPLLFVGNIENPEQVKALLATQSCLGGQTVEGVVIKNYFRFGKDKKVLMGKFVSEVFKEIHTSEWKKQNPTGKDFIGLLIEKYKSEARWRKAVQHLREAGKIEGSPRDIGPLIKEVWPDIVKECKEEIQNALWKWAEPHLSRGVIRRLPEWYRSELLKEQFKEKV